MPELVEEHDRAHDGDEGEDVPTHPIDESKGLIE
jgi:hypothetical protein